MSIYSNNPLGTAQETSEADEIINKLKWEPDDSMKQDKNGAWRYKPGTLDEFGRKIGGHFVPGAPSPNPAGRSNKEREIFGYFRDISMDAAKTLYEIMMDPNESSKNRAMTANMILDRGIGKPKQVTTIATDLSIADLIRPIIIRDNEDQE